MTDLEKALAEGGEPVDTDLSRALAEGGTPVGTDTPAAAAEPQKSLWQRAYERVGNTVVGGAKAIGHVAGDQADFALRALTNPADTFGTPEARAQAEKDFFLTNPAKRRELERGVGDVTTLGYANKAAEAVDRAFGGGKFTAAQQAEDAAAAPSYRTAGQIAGSVLPNAFGEVIGAGGKVLGATAERIAPEAVDTAAGVLSHLPAPVAAGAKGLTAYEAQAPAAAALSADANGHRLEAAKEAATDPTGLALSGGIGLAQGAAQRGIEKLREGAPAMEEGAKRRAVKDLGKDITSAEGVKSRATDQKRIAEVNDRLFDLTMQYPELRKVFAESAETALPKIAKAKDIVAEPLDRIQAAVDERTGGGIPLEKVTEGLRDRANDLAKKRSGLDDAKRFRALADQFEEAYAPKTQSLAEGSDTALADLQKLRETAKGPAATAIDDQIAALKSEAGGDVRIPTAQYRAEVTSLFKSADSIMGSIEGTPRQEALDKLYRAGKEILDEHLDSSGLPKEDLTDLRRRNDQYFLLSRAEAAIESRGWKEANREGFHFAHSARQALHGGLVPAAAYAMMHPAALPYLAGATALTKAVPAAAKSVNWRMANGAYSSALGRLAELARSQPPAQFIAAAVRAGLPAEAARRIAAEAQKNRTQIADGAQ